MKQNNNYNPAQLFALGYIERGWPPVPVPFREKGPTIKGWQNLRITSDDVPRYFPSPMNIGVRTGADAGWLVDIDLDHALAVELADEYLPATESVFGRSGKQRSHRLFRVTAPIESKAYKLPGDERQTVVEIRANGRQTVFPGSVHEIGERIEWDVDGEPTSIKPEELRRAVEALDAEVLRRLGLTRKEKPKRQASGFRTAQPIIERARKYIAKMDKAIEGLDGSGRAFAVACKLCIGFNLGRDDALVLMREYNQRCEPPWTEYQMAHKVDDALNEDGERGYLLVAERQTHHKRNGSSLMDDAIAMGFDVPGVNGHQREPGDESEGNAVGQNDQQPRKRAKLVRLDSVEPSQIEWLWKGRIPLGKISVLAGRPGLGKSLCTVDMGARVTTGADWPNNEGKAELGDVLILSGEDTVDDVIVPRFIVAGGDRKRATFLDSVETTDERGGKVARQFNFAADLEVLADVLEANQAIRLLVVDPIGAYLGRGTDSHKDADVRGVLTPLAALAAKHRVAVVLVAHLNKSTSSDAQSRLLGSIAFTALARSVWLVGRDKEDSNRRWFSCAKNNLGDDQLALSYELIYHDEAPPSIQWFDGGKNMTADEMLADDAEPSKDRKVEAAKQWLAQQLANGPQRAAEMFEQAKSADIAERTLRRAKSALGVEAFKEQFRAGWWWKMPDGVEVVQAGQAMSTSQSWPPSDDLATFEDGHDSQDGQHTTT